MAPSRPFRRFASSRCAKLKISLKREEHKLDPTFNLAEILVPTTHNKYNPLYNPP